MSAENSVDSQLSVALNAAIIPKLAEMGWSTGTDDDAALAEYIILVWSNGKTQDQLAAELSVDFFNLGPDDPGVLVFSKWLFEQADILRAQFGGAQTTQAAVGATKNEDTEMGDSEGATEAHIPTGPKSMRNSTARAPGSARDQRFMSQLTKTMERSHDPLRRVRPQGGTERINSHRTPPTGPRQQNSIKGAAGRGNGRQFNPTTHHNQAAQNVINMTPQQQFQLYAMLEQQTKYYANLLNPEQQQLLQQQMAESGMSFNPTLNNNTGRPQQGKSLFDRVQAPRNKQNKFSSNQGTQHQSSAASTDTDVQMSQPRTEASPDDTCFYNLKCTNKDCKFAHQSPAAPPGTAIDPSDICSFGAACKNRKCTGRHPSPGQKLAHQSEQECAFFPACTKGDSCPYRHPTTPPCRNGADCTVPNCKFAHNKTVCKWNPCTNRVCPYKHEAGQQRGTFEDKVWVAKEHVSERKFVDEDKPEELILPGSSLGASLAKQEEGMIA